LPFKPEEIPIFSVIRIPVVLLGQTVLKRFAVISHIAKHAYALKTTSRTETFDQNPERLQEVVIYEAGECPLFSKRTIIDPRNQFPISYGALIQHNRKGLYEHFGVLPAGFKQKLVSVIQVSKVIEPNRKQRLLAQLDGVSFCNGLVKASRVEDLNRSAEAMYHPKA
jgi:hypothetical protein